MMVRNRKAFWVAGAVLAMGTAFVVPGWAIETGQGMLEHLKHHTMLGLTVPANGDQNPYALYVSPITAGKIQKDDLLITNFNNSQNLQGLGTTVVNYRPSTKEVTLFSAMPRHWAGCPGGLGLTTAMAILKSGWVIVGSLPSQDGTTATKGDGCLIVMDANGNAVSSFSGPKISGPWGNMAVIDRGDTASLFVSNTGFGVEAPGQDEVQKATIVRIDLQIQNGQPPKAIKQTVIADGFGEKADKDVFIIGPTGLAIGANGDLYASDALANRIVAIPNAETRTDSAGTGRVVTSEGFLKRPLAMAMTPQGHLLVTNGLNGQIVEIDPVSGKQIYAQWVDPNKAQTPPGSGDLFGLAVTPDGSGIYYVEDELNALVLAH